MHAVPDYLKPSVYGTDNTLLLDRQLRLKGQVERDRWVEQAKKKYASDGSRATTVAAAGDAN